MDHDHADTRPRGTRGALRPCLLRGDVARALGGGRAVPRRGRRPAPEALPADDVPVPVGRPAHRPLVCRDRAGHRGPHAPHAGPTTSCSPWASTPSACRPRTRRSIAAPIRTTWTYANIERMRGQFRLDGLPASTGRREVVTSDPELLPLARSGCSSQFYKAGPGLSGHGRRRLVPQGPGRPGARAGRGRGSPLLALRHAGHQARPRAVVLPDHDATRTSCSTSSGIDWPEPIRLMQTNWIGRSRGRRDRLPGRGRWRGGDPASSRPGPTRSTARPSWSWRPSIRSSSALTTPDSVAEVEAYVAAPGARPRSSG